MARQARPKRASGRASRASATPSDPVEAALALAAERRWGEVTMADIAARAGMELAALHRAYPSRGALLAAFVDRIDEAVLAGTPPEAADEPVRDRLLDALLRRLDALGPHKRAVGSILRETLATPGTALCAAPRLLRSMYWTLEAAGVGPRGPFGLLRVKALAAIYVSALRVWLRDEDPDMARTMAHLDRRLRQAERLAGICGRLAPRGRPRWRRGADDVARPADGPPIL